jgi:hypothetical protein
MEDVVELARFSDDREGGLFNAIRARSRSSTSPACTMLRDDGVRERTGERALGLRAD